MSTASQFGGGGGGHIFTQFFPASTTYTIPATGKYLYGGGGGGVAAPTGSTSTSGAGGNGLVVIERLS